MSSVARDADTPTTTDLMPGGTFQVSRVLSSIDLEVWIKQHDGDVDLVRCVGELTPDVKSSARVLRVDEAQIVKSLVFKCDGVFVVVVTNGTKQVDPKKVAKHLGIANKRVKLASREETIDACGYVPGTVPPFGHRRILKTMVDETVLSAKNGVVFGGGGDVDTEAKVSVTELMRLTNGTALDLKKTEVTGAAAARTAATVRTIPEENTRDDERAETRKPNSTEKVAVPSTFDERYGGTRKTVSCEVAKVMGVAPGPTDDTEDTSEKTKSWRLQTAAAVSKPKVVSVVAEVLRVRRVAKFLVFATLRPLSACTLVPLDAHDQVQRDEARRTHGLLLVTDETSHTAGYGMFGVTPEAGSSQAGGELFDQEEGDADTETEKGTGSEYPLPPGTKELQLIAGRGLVMRFGEQKTWETLRGIKQGAVLKITGRVQANPRWHDTVDIVARGVTKVPESEAARMRVNAARSRVVASNSTQSLETTTATNAKKEEEWGVGAVSAVTTMAFVGFGGAKKPIGAGGGSSDKDISQSDAQRKLFLLKTGAREGGVAPYPYLPDHKTHWVCDLAGIVEMRAHVLGEGCLNLQPRDDETQTKTENAPTKVSHDQTQKEEEEIKVVGIDAEWVPKSGSPVAVLQLATRSDAFLVDTLAIFGASSDDSDASNDSKKETFDALNDFLADLFARGDIKKLGFGLEHDFARLKFSHAGMSCVDDVEESDVSVDDGMDTVGVSDDGITDTSVRGDGTVGRTQVRICHTRSFVDIRTLSLCAFPEKRKLGKAGLSTTVSSILGCYVDKTEQCSDWSLRPLTQAQAKYAASDAHVLTALFDRCLFKSRNEVMEALYDPSAPLALAPKEVRGEPRVRGLKQACSSPASSKKHPGPPRPSPRPPMTNADLVNAVGASFADGRKGVVDALTGYQQNGDQQAHSNGRGGGGLETAGNFVLVFVNVFGKQNKRRYFNEFWAAGGGERENGASVRMSWFGGAGAAGTLGGVSKALTETTAFASVGSFFGEEDEGVEGVEGDEGVEGVEGVEGDEGDAATCEADETQTQTQTELVPPKPKKKTVALFLRKEKGLYVCCGRLRAVSVAGDGTDESGTAKVVFHLVDAGKLRESGKMEALLGEGLGETRGG